MTIPVVSLVNLLFVASVSIPSPIPPTLSLHGWLTLLIFPLWEKPPNKPDRRTDGRMDGLFAAPLYSESRTTVDTSSVNFAANAAAAADAAASGQRLLWEREGHGESPLSVEGCGDRSYYL